MDLRKRAFLVCTGFLVGGCIAFTPASAGALGAPLLPIVINATPHSLAALLSVSRVCVYVTYDKNGNRLTQNAGSVATGQTLWGAGTYGCFNWKE